MDLINIKKIIDNATEDEKISGSTLKAIEKIVNSNNAIYQIIHEGFKEMQESKEMQVIQKETSYYLEHETEILTQMVKKAFHILQFKGSEEMVKYLNENFSIYWLTDREKELLK